MFYAIDYNKIISNIKRIPMKTKILYILDNMQPDDCTRALSRIINRLSRERYELYLSCPNDSDFYKTINKDVQYMPLDFTKKISPGLIIKLAGIIRRNRIGIVHACGAGADLHGRLAMPISGGARYVSTITLTGEEFDADRSRKIKPGLFARISGRFVDRFVASSDLLRKRVTGKGGVNPDKIIRIYNGVDTDRFRFSPEARDRIRSELDIADDTILIGAAGRLVWQKGYEFLVKSIPIFARNHPNTRVLIAGEGPFRDHLMMHSSMMGLNDHIILAGLRNDMEDLLSALDVLVIPSLVDEFPMISLEGMATAKPVIATRVEGIREQVTDNETGLLVLSWNADALAKAIKRVIEDRGLAEHLGKRAREKVEREFSEEKMIAETEGLYQSLCEERG